MWLWCNCVVVSSRDGRCTCCVGLEGACHTVNVAIGAIGSDRVDCEWLCSLCWDWSVRPRCMEHEGYAMSGRFVLSS